MGDIILPPTVPPPTPPIIVKQIRATPWIRGAPVGTLDLTFTIPNTPTGKALLILIKSSVAFIRGDINAGYYAEAHLYYYDPVAAAYVERACCGETGRYCFDNITGGVLGIFIMDITDVFNPGDTVTIRLSIEGSTTAYGQYSFNQVWVEVYPE